MLWGFRHLRNIVILLQVLLNSTPTNVPTKANKVDTNPTNRNLLVINTILRAAGPIQGLYLVKDAKKKST